MPTNHNNFASVGFINWTVNDMLCPLFLDSSEEKSFQMLYTS